MPSPINAKEVLGILQTTGLNAPIIDRSELRWDHLRCACPSGFDLCDRFRGARVGGAIEDAMGRPNEGIWPSETRARRIWADCERLRTTLRRGTRSAEGPCDGAHQTHLPRHVPPR